MTDNSVPDHLKITQLYDRAVSLYYQWSTDQSKVNPDDLHRLLDPILAMGKAIGRRSALDELKYPEELEQLRSLVAQFHRDLSQVRMDPYHLPQTITKLRRTLVQHEDHDRLETNRNRNGFEDGLINGWLKIVDGDVPRETSKEN